MELDEPVCTRTRPGEEVNEAKTGVRRVQLVVLRDTLWPRVNAVVGTRLHARGRLFSNHTGHHHAPILPIVDSIARAEPGR